MKKAKLIILSAVVFSSQASASDNCGYGCSSKTISYSDASLTVKVGSEVRLCSNPDEPIYKGIQTQYQVVNYGICD